MRGRMRSLEASPLIDSDIDQDGARLHGLQHVTGDKLRSCGAWNQNGANQKVGPLNDLADSIPCREDRANLGTELRRDPSQRLRGTVDHRDIPPIPSAIAAA